MEKLVIKDDILLVICYEFSEDPLFEKPAKSLFGELGWKTLNCFYKIFGENGAFGGETRIGVLLVLWLHSTLERLNLDPPKIGH